MIVRKLCFLAGAGALATALWANRDGALPFKTGGPFPGESVCTECHSNGTISRPNQGPGSVMISAQPYRPGETQRITITVADPGANQLRWGFELTARLASALSSQAGSFRAADTNSQVICGNDTPAPCASGLLQFATHTRDGTRRGTRGSVSFLVDWTAPASDVGEVILAAAGNAANGNDLETGDNIYITQMRIAADAAAPTFTSVSSASFAANDPLAAEVIAAGFGTGLARDTAVASTVPLPTDLLGTRVEVTDSAGTARPAPLFFVSPAQINYLIPAGTALGAARVRVTSAGGTIDGTMTIDRVAPSLFSANAQGNGVAAALFLKVAGDGTRTQGLLFDPAVRPPAAVPVDLGGTSDQVFLLLFGTGIRGVSSGGVTATVGGQSVPVLGAVPQGEFVGLDQVNIGPLPRALAGRGEVDIVLSFDGKAANTVKVNIR